MSNISQIKALGSIVSKSLMREIDKQSASAPGGWTLKDSNEGYLQQGAQCYAAVGDGSSAKVGISNSTPIVGP
tara:strand:+ start:364 stop:582 length:219 start_codon:yes stop_codon:yes gene_type:complete